MITPLSKDEKRPVLSDWGALEEAQAKIVELRRELMTLRADAKSVALLLLDNDKKGVMDWARGIVMKLGKPGEVDRLTTVERAAL